jgi:hypothetical protein
MKLPERILFHYKAMQTLLRVDRVARSFGLDTKLVSNRYHRHMRIYWILQNRYYHLTGKYLPQPLKECCAGECHHQGNINLYIAKLELGMK